MGGYENRQIIKFIRTKELHNKFFSIAHYVKAEDALDLPDKQDITIECELNAKTKRIYHEINSEFISMVDAGVITVDNALVKLLRLSQIAGEYGTITNLNTSVQTISLQNTFLLFFIKG